MRELGRATKAAPLVVVLRAQIPVRGGEHFRSGKRGVFRRCQRGGAANGAREFVRVLEELTAAVAPGVVDRPAHVEEAGHARPRLLRKVRAAVERPAFGVAEHGHRPSAASADGLDGIHVDRVDVGTLLSVDLHVHEQVVHARRDLVLEALVGHDVAPVTRGVADGEHDGLVLGLRLGERLVAPRIPVDRVVLVLTQVRTGGIGQAIHLAEAIGVRC